MGSGKRTSERAKAFSFGPMATSLRANGRKTRLKARASYNLNRGKSTKAFGRTTSYKVFIIVYNLLLSIIAKKSGKGVFIRPNGDTYEGSWKEDKREGLGSELLKNGEKYQGNWTNNQREGHGAMTYPNGDRYEGMFKSNYPEGKGVRYFSNGDRYEGEFLQGHLHGKG